MNTIQNFIRDFAREDDGAQVIEYALIIAVVSIALILAIKSIDGSLSGFVTRVTDCLTAGSTCK